MQHKLKISISDKPELGGIVHCRNVTLRERMLRKLFGNPSKVTIIVPGDSVKCLSIEEVPGVSDEV